MKRLLAIDPGTAQSAFVVWDGAVLLEHGIMENCLLLAQLRTGWPFHADACTLEMVASYGMAVGKEVFETVRQIGRMQEILERRMPVQLVYRLQVKQHLCHDSRAKDANIRQALIDRFGAPGTKKSPGLTYGVKADVWQAFALAVTIWDLEHSKIQSPS